MYPLPLSQLVVGLGPSPTVCRDRRLLRGEIGAGDLTIAETAVVGSWAADHRVSPT